MFIRKFLSASKVDDVNAKGQFIKVLNCESIIRLRATYQGELVFETDAKAGFDVETKTPFDHISITSGETQKIELWVSIHKLTYDALSTKASRSSSFLVDHYGEGQMILGSDSAQSRAQVLCETEFWVGGEGVDKFNGMRIAPSTVYKHDSAAPLHAYIDEKKTYKAIIENPVNVKLDAIQDYGSVISKLNDDVYMVHGAGRWQTDTGLINFSDMSFKRLDKNIIGVFDYEGEILAVKNNDTQGEFVIRYLAENGDAESKKVDIDLGVPLSVRAFVFDGEHVFFSGVMNGGFEKAKVGVYNMATGDLSIKDYELTSGGVSAMFIDSVTGEHILYTGSSAYKGDFFTGAFNTVGLGGTASPYVAPSFFDDEIVFYSLSGSNSYAKIFKRDGLELIDTRGSMRAIYKTGDTFIYLDSVGIGQTKDDFVTKEVKYTLEGLNIEEPQASGFLQHETGLYCFAVNSSDKREFIKFPLIADTAEPKTRFRVFKESY